MNGMSRLQILALLSSLSALVVASPTPLTPPTRTLEVRADGGFSIAQVQVAGAQNGPAQYIRDLRKRGIEAPRDVHIAAAQQTGSVVATPGAYDTSYLCPVVFDNTTLNLQFDTGSVDLWVYSAKQPSSETKGHSIIPCNIAPVPNTTWNIQYGGGVEDSGSGIVIKRKVVVGGATVTGQAVECATHVGTSFSSDVNTDGLLGLGFQLTTGGTSQPFPTFFANLMKTLPLKLFAVAFKFRAPGTFDFGFLDSAKYKGTIVYSPVKTPTTDWLVTPAGYSIGSGPKVASTFNILPDTGSSIMNLPGAVVASYFSQVPGSSNSSGQWKYPCKAVLPSFSFFFGSTKRTLNPVTFLFYQADETTCVSGIQAQSDDDPISVLGDVFFKSMYVVFDQGNSRVGFAQQA